MYRATTDHGLIIMLSPYQTGMVSCCFKAGFGYAPGGASQKPGGMSLEGNMARLL